MINLIEPGSLKHRLKVWSFMIDWTEDVTYLHANIR